MGLLNLIYSLSWLKIYRYLKIRFTVIYTLLSLKTLEYMAYFINLFSTYLLFKLQSNNTLNAYVREI